MQDMMTTQFLWATLIVGGIVGIVVLTRAPELLIAMLLVASNTIQLIFRLLGLQVTRTTFAVAGSVIFIPVVLLILVMRMVQTRERQPIIGRPNLPFVFMTILMGIVLLVGLTYTDAPRYGSQKTGEYFIFGVAPMILAFVFLRDRASVSRLLIWVAVIGATSALTATAYSLSTRGTIFALLQGFERSTAEAVRGHSGLSTPVLVAVGAVLAIAAGRRSGVVKRLPLVIMPVAGYFIVAAGTRSNLIAFVFVALVGTYFAYKEKRGVFFVTVAMLLILGGLFFAYAPQDIQERYSHWYEEGTLAGRGGFTRVQWLKLIARESVHAPILGYGTGGWAMLSGGGDWYDFPHNMFGEMLIENGIVGLTVLLVLWYIVFRRIWRLLRTADVGTRLYGIAVFGMCLMATELINSLAHFGLAHHSCTVLLSSAIVLRSTFLVERAEAMPESEESEVTPLVRPVVGVGPLSR